MKTTKRILALLVTLCMILSLAPAVFAEEAAPEAMPLANEDEIIIYYTNDVHTYIDGAISYDNIAALKTATEAEAAKVYLVDAGDHVQGTAYGSMDKGDTIIELMNAAGYGLATLGNHEFDYGMEKALENIENAEFKYVSCNFVHVYKNPYTDVKEDDWYAEHAKAMAYWGIITGMTEDTFVANGQLTRAQFATMLYRMAEEPDASGLEHPFTDVAADAWYADAVAWAYDTEIVKGITDTTFGPDSVLTRQMMVTMLYRAYAAEEDVIAEDALDGYTDAASVAEYAKDAMAWAITYGLVNGVTETTLEPEADCLRSHAAKILHVGFYRDSVLYWTVYTEDEVSVAFIGITTPESFTKSTPAYFQDEDGNYIYDIKGGEDGKALYQAVQDAIDSIVTDVNPDYVIGLAHLGDDPASKPWTSEEVIANTSGLDAVIDGHSHSTVPGKVVKDKDGNDVILTQTGEYFNNIGRMVITKDGIETGLISIVEVEDPETEEVIDTYVGLTKADGTTVNTGWELGSDEAVAKIKNDWMTEIDTALGEVIGEATVALGNYDAEGNRLVRSQETNTGDFCADALYFLFENQGLDVDVAIMNGGGIRNKTDITGEISYKTCKEIHTFGNVACLQTISGQQLLDALEWGAKNAGSGENGGFLQVSGLKYTIDTSIPSTVQADEKGVWIGGPTGEYRVKDVMILQDGEYVPLDLDAKYNLAGYNYTLRDLGDGFAMFDGAVNVLDYVMEDYLVLANYIIEGLDGVIGEEYAELNGQGRITIK